MGSIMDLNLKTAIAAMAMLKMEMKSKFSERGEVIDCMAVSLINQSHLLMVGPPGSGKTRMVSEFSKAMKGVCYFEKQMTNFTEPKHVWGPLDIKKYMDTGIDECQIAGMLPEAEIAMLDECGRGSKSIMDELLVLLSDRRYKHGSKLVNVPLMTCFGASNTFFEEGQEALFDRFLLRVMVPWVSDMSLKRQIRRSRKAPVVASSLTREHLLLLQKEVSNVTIPDSVEDIVDEILISLKQAGIERSDRRWQWLMNAVAANALVNGRMVAEASDLLILAHGLWDKEDEIKIVAGVVKTQSNKALAEAEALLDDTIEEWEEILQKDGGISGVATARLDRFMTTIGQRGKTLDPTAPGVKEVLGKFRNLYKEIQLEKRNRLSKDTGWMDGV